jgi:hypothetical protein
MKESGDVVVYAGQPSILSFSADDARRAIFCLRNSVFCFVLFADPFLQLSHKAQLLSIDHLPCRIECSHEALQFLLKLR